ncbi:MAG: hypothetical protein ABI369_01955 [Acetobacteraceae bacterium]
MLVPQVGRQRHRGHPLGLRAGANRHYMGWNVGRAGHFESGMCNLQGSFIPFARDRAEREPTGDPRPPLAERHPDKSAYATVLRTAADRLVTRPYRFTGRRQA